MAILNVEIADNPMTLAQGLMHVKKMDKTSGMLFKFQYPQHARFWGKDTYIPLDIAFITADNKIAEIKNITPMSTRMVPSTDMCTMAIETNAGFFKENNIEPGYTINIKDNTIEFTK